MTELLTTTDKWACRMVAQSLVAYGVRHVVASPGSRNTPLLMAVARTPELKVHPVVDERSAAFIALGMARTSGTPVALVCTSGTAMLNYGPALAEAYYSGAPLIAVTADRPQPWIDQADSQTIRQPGALPTVTKTCVSFDGDARDEESRSHICRMLNDALTTATTPPCGPVQINVGLSVPLGGESETDPAERFPKIDTVRISGGLHNSQARALAGRLASRRVLVVAGFMAPSAPVSRAMATLASLPNVAVLAEGLANIHARGVHECFERHLPTADRQEYHTDILLTLGGPLVSAKLKSLLRKMRVAEHWHISTEPYAVDTFRHLTTTLAMTPEDCLPKISNALAHLTRTGENTGIYASLWRELMNNNANLTPDATGWNAPAAIINTLAAIPPAYNIELSNGMSVRCALQFPLSRFHRVGSNRGVSGIDGSISTAVGASILSPNPTLLITGDMSFQYDLGAITSTLVSPKLKIVVMNNGGGGIFSYVSSTANLPERRELLQCNLRLPLRQIADTWGMLYLRADSLPSLRQAVRQLVAESERPVLLEVLTDPGEDAAALRAIQGLQ